MRPLMNPTFVKALAATGGGGGVEPTPPGPSGPSGPYNGQKITEVGADYINYATPRTDFPTQTKVTTSFFTFISTVNASGKNPLLCNYYDDNRDYSFFLMPGPPEHLLFRAANHNVSQRTMTLTYNLGAPGLFTKNAWHHIYLECDMATYGDTTNPLGARLWIDNTEVTWDSIASVGTGFSPIGISNFILYFGTGQSIAGMYEGDWKIAQVRHIFEVDGGTTNLAALWNGGAGLGTHYTNAAQYQEILFTEQAGGSAEDTSDSGVDHDANVGNSGGWITGDFSETTF